MTLVLKPVTAAACDGMGQASRSGGPFGIPSAFAVRRHPAEGAEKSVQPGHPLALRSADRALIASLLGLIPKARHDRLRLIVTPALS
ncbi:hypothetical protein KGQ20_08060 [Catenulispora sp. NF23]|uniref:Uncharacterized protein n=1 Tax=Catenulispora pinistramenti TaxID=2705254 RepID=A0ABS5KP76_9ACTN|nr:hypothetical protein [Catenulispora pinistramenti]MBS2532726.1 hypothetical protein [Catenulispora pinistramenti]MBS2547857.1 hypothetical protein [Catenulispora pinistramenti]